MKTFIIALLLSSGIALAQSPDERFNTDGIDEIFANPCTTTPFENGEARVECINVVRPYTGPQTHAYTIENVGTVVILYTGTLNLDESEAEDADTVEIISVPDGFYASPNKMTLVEKSAGTIRIIEYVAG